MEYNLERFKDIFQALNWRLMEPKSVWICLALAVLAWYVSYDTTDYYALDGGANDKTVHAVPKPGMDFFEKENVRVYEVVFKAIVGPNGWVSFGDTTVVVP